MGLLKTAIYGAAIYAAVKYVTKKDPVTGNSMLDDLSEKAPEWAEKSKNLANNLKDLTNSVKEKMSQ